jgi:single-strand DNA-binding protein
MEQMTIIGHVGRDSEIMETNGNKFLKFSVGCYSSYKNNEGQKVEKTNWYNVISKQTNLYEFIKSGTKIYISGNLRTSIYKHSSGENRISLDINTDKIVLLSKKENESETVN